jgi:transketolase
MGDIIGMDRFGESAPAKALLQKFGYTVENVVARAKKIVGSRQREKMPNRCGQHP